MNNPKNEPEYDAEFFAEYEDFIQRCRDNDSPLTRWEKTGAIQRQEWEVKKEQQDLEAERRVREREQARLRKRRQRQDPEKRRLQNEAHKRWEAKNPDKVKKNKTLYRLRHKDEINRKRREKYWRKKNETQE